MADNANIHHRHLLPLGPKTDTCYTIPQKKGSLVDLGGWLRTTMVYLPADSHPSRY